MLQVAEEKEEDEQQLQAAQRCRQGQVGPAVHRDTWNVAWGACVVGLCGGGGGVCGWSVRDIREG